MSSSTSNQGGGIFDNSTVLISVWMVALFLFLCFPFCVNKRSRMLCRKRIQERRWDVHLGAEHDEMWYRIATQRYDRYRARLAASELGSSNLSKEQEEVIRQLHLLERMGPYTALIQRDDIRNSGQKLDSSHYEQSDSHGGNDIEADNDTSDNEVDTMQVDFALSKQCSETIVRVPHAGEVMGSAETRRDIPNGCAICLSEFEAGHRVTWASNGDCPHCFHEQCILNWMLAVGKKKQLERNPNDTMDQSVDPIQLAITFPKLCPCCRRPFFAPVMTTNHDFCDQSSMIPLASPTSTTANISMDLSDDISMVPRPDLVSPVNLNQNSDDNPSFSSAREPQQNDYI